MRLSASVVDGEAGPSQAPAHIGASAVRHIATEYQHHRGLVDVGDVIKHDILCNGYSISCPPPSLLQRLFHFSPAPSPPPWHYAVLDKKHQIEEFFHYPSSPPPSPNPPPPPPSPPQPPASPSPPRPPPPWQIQAAKDQLAVVLGVAPTACVHVPRMHLPAALTLYEQLSPSPPLTVLTVSPRAGWCSPVRSQAAAMVRCGLRERTIPAPQPAASVVRAATPMVPTPAVDAQGRHAPGE